jgi:hypothetical protein
MRYWFLAQRCIGVDSPNVNQFTDVVIEDTLARMKADSDHKLATEDTDIRKPEKLADLAKWTKFWELLTTYLGRVKGAALTPLSYLVREHDEVTEEQRDAENQSTQERLIAITAFNGTHFDLDNRTLYDEFKPLVVDGPGWSFIKKFDKLKDGCGAVLALKAQAEGTSAKLTRKQAAYASLASSAYLGPRKGFTFASYVTLHQSAHNELLDLDEPVSESKKVTDFLKGIRDPNLNTGKSIVLGDPGKLGDFEECQQYLSTVVQNMSAQMKSERQVSSAWHVRDRRRPDGRRWHRGQADDTDAYDTDAYDTADKQTTQTAARGIVQGDETQTTSQTSRRHRRQREELVQGYDSLQSEDLNDKVRGHNLYD